MRPTSLIGIELKIVLIPCSTAVSLFFLRTLLLDAVLSVLIILWHAATTTSSINIEDVSSQAAMRRE